MQRFSVSARRGLRWAVWPVGALLGVAVEAVTFGFCDLRDAIPDLLTGWGLLGAGLFAAVRAPSNRTGALLAAAGAAWFMGSLFDPFLYLHRGLLLHVLLVYPTGRASTAEDRVAVAAGYVAALATPVWRDEFSSIAAAAVLVTVLLGRYVTAVGRLRRARRLALDAGVALAAVIGGGALARLALPSGDADELVLLVYEAVVVAVACWLAVGIVNRPWEHVPLTDLVVDLAERSGMSLENRLARALGDPTLQVVEHVGGDVGRATSGRGEQAITLVYRDGAAVAELVHDRSIIGDPSLADAVSAVALLTASHGRLEAEVRARIGEVAASQVRLLHAAEDERRRLELDLRAGAGARLLALRERLADPRFQRVPDVDRLVGQAHRRIDVALADLDAIARGLHPRGLLNGGLAWGLAELAATSAVEVDVRADVPRLQQDVEAVAYYVCAEAVANVAKHARARRVVIEAEVRDGNLQLCVCDDGVGGAEVIRGGGLDGLRERVEAIGGVLTVDAPAAGGTLVKMTLDLSRVRA